VKMVNTKEQFIIHPETDKNRRKHSLTIHNRKKIKKLL